MSETPKRAALRARLKAKGHTDEGVDALFLGFDSLVRSETLTTDDLMRVRGLLTAAGTALGPGSEPARKHRKLPGPIILRAVDYEPERDQ